MAVWEAASPAGGFAGGHRGAPPGTVGHYDPAARRLKAGRPAEDARSETDSNRRGGCFLCA